MLHPIAPYLLVQPILNKETEGGLALPDDAKSRPQMGELLEDAGDLKKGTVIYFRSFAGEPIGDYLLVHGEDVIAWDDGKGGEGNE